jgi:hypothetical protein
MRTTAWREDKYEGINCREDRNENVKLDSGCVEFPMERMRMRMTKRRHAYCSCRVARTRYCNCS